MSDERPQLFVNCACYGEGIWLVYDTEDGQTSVSLWDSHIHSKGSMPWRVRLKHIWKIIRRGTPFDDDIILEPKEARAVAEFLTRHNPGV